MDVAVLNVGSATVKAARYCETDSGPEQRARIVISRDPRTSLSDLCQEALLGVGADREGIHAIGHRFVHGGIDLVAPTLVDTSVEAAIEANAPFAPVHNPAALIGLRAARSLLPNRTMIAVFDTAFHASRPAASYRYAIPSKLAEEFGLYRYGFHGTAHASLVESLATAEGHPPNHVDAVTLQLGSGCSACAVRAGRSIETSMGFSPLEGLAMPTRAGDLDSAVVLHLLRQGYSVEAVDRLLQTQSGLLGMAGSSDVRTLLANEASGDTRAADALSLFVQRIVSVVGAYWTLLEGRGALVFGGGIGTNSPEIRRRVCERLRTAWDVTLNPEANTLGSRRLSTINSRPVFAFETDEELQISRATLDFLDAPGVA